MKKKKVLKRVLIGIGVFVLADVLVSVVMAGSMAGIGPFGFLHEKKVLSAAGNAQEYAVTNYAEKQDSPLNGKSILFLGSSVTKGACSLDESMADYLAKADGVRITKEAVNGTTLATAHSNSYVERLSKLDRGKSYDCIVVQLSTNDASKKVELGALSTSESLESFDTDTVIGAMEYIVKYCTDNYHCPVVFYTGTRYDNELYKAMVAALYEVQDKWGIGVIDLWNAFRRRDKGNCAEI